MGSLSLVSRNIYTIFLIISITSFLPVLFFSFINFIDNKINTFKNYSGFIFFINVFAVVIMIYICYKVILSNPELFDVFKFPHKITDEVHSKVMKQLEPKPAYITKQNVSKTSLFGKEKYYNNYDFNVFDRQNEDETYEPFSIVEEVGKEKDFKNERIAYRKNYKKDNYLRQTEDTDKTDYYFEYYKDKNNVSEDIYTDEKVVNGSVIDTNAVFDAIISGNLGEKGINQSIDSQLYFRVDNEYMQKENPQDSNIQEVD
jgi:hypothetical protein